MIVAGESVSEAVSADLIASVGGPIVGEFRSALNANALGDAAEAPGRAGNARSVGENGPGLARSLVSTNRKCFALPEN